MVMMHSARLMPWVVYSLGCLHYPCWCAHQFLGQQRRARLTPVKGGAQVLHRYMLGFAEVLEAVHHREDRLAHVVHLGEVGFMLVRGECTQKFAIKQQLRRQC